MSVKVMGMVFDMEMEPDEKLVLLAYADHANHDGGDIFPAIERIAWKTGYSERTVQRITHNLVEKGYLVAAGKGPHGTNKWRIPIYGGDKMSPRKYGTGDKKAMGGDNHDTPGVTSTTERGDIAVSPESSLTVIKPSLESLTEKEKILKDLEAVGPPIFGHNFTDWRALSRALEKPSVQMHREDGRVKITGLGMKAAIYQDCYSRSFSNALTGIYNHPTEVVFEE